MDMIVKYAYGQHKDLVKVYYDNAPGTVEYPVDMFNNKFALTIDDWDMIEETGRLERFDNIGCAVFERDLDFFRGGLELYCCPLYFEEQSVREKLKSRILSNVDAVIIILSAIKLFSYEEKTFIRNLLNENSKVQNVFFVMNRINQLAKESDVELVKGGTEKMLKPLFTDENGFDKSLYNSRVFFVNAYGALDMEKRGQWPIGTQIPEFRDALMYFLHHGK